MAQFNDLSFDIVWLATLWNFRHTRQIDKSQVDDCAGENFAENGLSTDLFVVTTFALCVNLYLISRLLQIEVLLTWLTCKLDPVLGCRWRVHKLNNCRPSRHNIRSPWQEIAAADALQHA